MPRILTIAISFIISQSSPLTAAVVVLVEQRGFDVVFTGSGSANTRGLSALDPNSIRSYLNVGFPGLVLGPTGFVATYEYFVGFVDTPSPFGSSNAAVGPSFGSGDRFGVGRNLILPFNYVSGSPLEGSMTFSNATFESLDINPGVYTWVFGSGANIDTFTVIVPESSTFALFAIGSSLLIIRRTKKANSHGWQPCGQT